MKNRVYYGQYSLKYWIELMLSENIICPPYQRRFVWTEQSVQNFLQFIMKDDLFIPPITIGVVSRTNERGKIEKVNYIIDGQQRLTSLLLSYLRVFPKPVKEFMDTPIENTNEENQDKIEHLTNWQFKKLVALQRGGGQSITKKAIESGHYKEYIIEGINDDFLNSHYLGYSYIVPDVDDSDAQSTYFSKLFNTLNSQGTTLTPQQSRLALYFLNPKLESWFSPQFCKDICIYPNSSKRAPIDFVRYVSILSDYNKRSRKGDVLKGYDSRGGDGDKKLKTYEEYYRDYIYSIVENKDDERFGEFGTIFGDIYEARLNKLRNTIEELGIKEHKFATIVDVDIYFFGLVYYTVFKGFDVEAAKKEKVIRSLNRHIEQYKQSMEGKNVATVENLRQRLIQSIKIYSHYINH